jgi:hypothetical protein
MEALHKPTTDVAGETQKDLIVVLESDSSSSSGWAVAGGESDAQGSERGQEKEQGDLLGMVGQAWCEYEQELMGQGVKGTELAPAVFIQGLENE